MESGFFVFGDFRRDFHRLSEYAAGFLRNPDLHGGGEGFEFRRSLQLPVKHLVFERVTREYDPRLESLQFP